jgi:adenylate cyclase
MLCLQLATAILIGLLTLGQARAEIMRIAPNFSIEGQRRILPYKNPDDFERRVEGGRIADLPV